MSWYDDAFRRRKAITVHSAAGGGSFDADITIPPDWDEFWDEIDSAGNELRVTRADGYTLLTYDVDNGSGGAFSLASRLGRIRIDTAGAVGTATETCLFWVYFDSTSTQGDASQAVTMTSVLTGYIELAAPSTYICSFEPPRAGLTAPRQSIGKGASDDLFVWLDLSQQLSTRVTKFANRMQYEEPIQALYSVVNGAGAAQAAMITAADTRWVEVVEGNARRLFLRVRVKAGTSGTNYTLIATVTTTNPVALAILRTLIARIGIIVYDLLES